VKFDEKHAGYICLTELHSLDKVNFTRTMNNTFSVQHFVLFIYSTIKLEGTACP